MEIIVYSIMIFIIGICFGSFFNVVGYRLPNDMSIIYPPSHCTNCNHKLGALELIPILSYIFQKGRCKHCHEKISLFYPMFELLTGVLFVLGYLAYKDVYPEIINKLLDGIYNIFDNNHELLFNPISDISKYKDEYISI